MELIFTLSFSKNQWICYNKSIKITADSLDEVDENIELYIKNSYEKGIFNIKIFFDFDRFPEWHRQYMPHYFNRNFTINTNL